jgi:hypothetical protein
MDGGNLKGTGKFEGKAAENTLYKKPWHREERSSTKNWAQSRAQ